MQKKNLLVNSRNILLGLFIMIVLTSLASAVYEDFAKVSCKNEINQCHLYEDAQFQTVNNTLADNVNDDDSINSVSGWGNFDTPTGIYYDDRWLRISNNIGDGYNVSLNETTTDYKFCFTLNHSESTCNYGRAYAIHFGTGIVTNKAWGCSSDNPNNFEWFTGSAWVVLGSATTPNIYDFCIWYNTTDSQVMISQDDVYYETGDAGNPFIKDYDIILEGAQVPMKLTNISMWNWTEHGFTGAGLFEGQVTDSTPPIITTDLINNSDYNTDINFYVSINEAGQCAINNSLWSNTPNVNNTYFEFTDLGTQNQNYNIEISCNDTTLNNDIAIYNFTKKTPTISILYPIDGSNVDDDPFNLTFSFNNFNPNNCTAYFNYSGNFTQFDSLQTGNTTIIEYVNTSIPYINLSNVVSWYRMEEGNGTNITDSSGNNFHGTLTNGATYSTTKGGNSTGNYSTIYDGQNDYANLGSRTGFKSISLWAYIDSRVGYDYFIGHNNFRLYSHTTTGMIHFDDSTGGSITTTYDVDLHNGEWIHIVAVNNGASSQIFINNISYGTSNLEAITPATMNIGNYPTSGHFYHGKIDEVIIFDTSLNNKEVSLIYSNGLDRINFTQIANETIINLTLNQSTNYTFDFSFPSETKKDINYFINCENGVSINSTINLMHYDNDFTPPIINMSFPNASEENLAYNFNLWLNFTTSESAVCSVNETAFNDTVNYDTNFNLREEIINNSAYTFNLTCIDTSIHTNTVSQLINITKDKLAPNINFINPLPNNLSSILNDGVLEIDFNTSDDIGLYSINWNVTRVSDDLIIYANSLNISGLAYHVQQNINSENLSNSTYKLSGEVCDAHTKKAIKDFVRVDKFPERINFQLNDKSYLKIRTDNPKVKNTNAIKEKDRYKFGFEYNANSGEKEYIIESNGVIDYLEDSQYKGHFVILTSEGKYWLDFENDNDYPVSVRQENNTYIVSIPDTAENITFNSIGELNCYSESTLFELSAISESYNTNIIAGTNWFNTSILNPSTTSGVLMYVFLFMILVASFVLAEITQIPFIAILSAFLGLFYGILLFTTISAIFGAIMSVLSVMYVFRAIIMFKN